MSECKINCLLMVNHQLLICSLKTGPLAIRNGLSMNQSIFINHALAFNTLYRLAGPLANRSFYPTVYEASQLVRVGLPSQLGVLLVTCMP